MSVESAINFVKDVLENMPSEWRNLTTHRLDIYNERLAKVQFSEQFEELFVAKQVEMEILKQQLKGLPTAYDYIRLGHPLSCILEWIIAKSNDQKIENIISFSSQIMPILAILRKNLLDNINTQIIYKNELPCSFEADDFKEIYGYKYELLKIKSYDEISSFDGTTIVLAPFDEIWSFKLAHEIDFVISIHNELGSITLVNGQKSEKYISEIQHVRRRESIAMTPDDCYSTLVNLTQKSSFKSTRNCNQKNKDLVINSIRKVTSTKANASLGSCGLSIQYSIMMALIHHSKDKYNGRDIKFIVPPNCYGGTNDQARRVAACIENVEILDLPVDGNNDMVQSIETVLEQVARIDGVPFIIAEIPTNPRVEVPDMDKLRDVLAKSRKTKDGKSCIAPVFILDQTFCPNMKFLGEGEKLSNIKTISYVSGSKFPSGGLCTAGYNVVNKKAEEFVSYIDHHLKLCGNEATAFQIEVLAKQMPSMNQRIFDAYNKTRDFVNFIKDILPAAKINFVSEDLAAKGFTPSVFSLDLPTKGDTHEERESYKRDLNLKLISLMINEIPHESKHCVSYGQLNGCYWTIPATSTQGTTKEGDKDYIVRVAISPEFDLSLHQKVFSRFCNEHI